MKPSVIVAGARVREPERLRPDGLAQPGGVGEKVLSNLEGRRRSIWAVWRRRNRFVRCAETRVDRREEGWPPRAIAPASPVPTGGAGRRP